MKYCSPTANVIIVNAERILCQSNNAATAKRKAEIERERKAEKREELEQRESELVVEYGPFVQKLLNMLMLFYLELPMLKRKERLVILKGEYKGLERLLTLLEMRALIPISLSI